MSIDRDRFVKRLEELKAQSEQARQQFIATAGAISDVEFWIQQLDSETPSTPAPIKTPKLK